jgi:hypothetical protein
MRNHASAAHPNENHVDGFEMVAWLTSCIRYAITAQPQHSVIKIKMLLENVRTQAISANDAPIIGEDIKRLASERVDDLLWTFFGLYVDPRQTPQTRLNIKLLAGYAWEVTTEDRKYEIGAKYGTFRKNGDTQRTQASEEFLISVNGATYKDEDSLAGELIEKLGNLKSVHYGSNNFYNEFAHARILGESLPVNGIIPRAARSLWVKVISICYIGNGLGYREGVDETAVSYYTAYIKNFTEKEVVEFVYLFSDPEFTLPLSRPKCDSRTRTLGRLLFDNTENVLVKNALQTIMQAPIGVLDRIALTEAYKNAVSQIPRNR